jgi:hypothetical protein
VVSAAPPPSRDEVLAFLAGRPGRPGTAADLGWNVWIGDQANLTATAQRLTEVFERGPLPLPDV